MNKTIWTVLWCLIAIVGGFYVLNSYIYNEKQAPQMSDHLNAEYMIEGKIVKLADGLSEIEAAPGSASKIITRYFGNELKTDLNEDGREDIVFILTQETGGTGTNFYVVAALNTTGGIKGSEGYLLGDRIAPQGIVRGSGKIVVVNFADRAEGEPYTTAPSMGKTVKLILDTETLLWGIVENNFTGEADPSRMTLQMKTWTWVSVQYNDGREVRPSGTKAFTLTFSNDGKFSATTDCNSMGGKYNADENTIAFTDIYQTEMYCEGSKESDFLKLLQTASGYHFTSFGQLILDLKFDSGSVVLK